MSVKNKIKYVRLFGISLCILFFIINLYIIRTNIHYDEKKQVYLDSICMEKVSKQQGKITDIKYELYNYRISINILNKCSGKNINVSVVVPSSVIDDNNNIYVGDDVNLEVLYKKSAIVDDNDFDFYNPFSIVSINNIPVNKMIKYNNVLISNPIDVLIQDDFMLNKTSKFIFINISFILIVFFIPVITGLVIKLIIIKDIINDVDFVSKPDTLLSNKSNK